MSLAAYQKAAQRAEQPRDLEYRLFGQVTRALIDASQTPDEDVKTRIDALDWNRRMWTALATDCSSEHNTLPQQLRASIISLSIFVSKHTSAVMRREDDFETLIDINKMMMQGLSGRPEAA
jgi:flagellar protein FlaF